MAGKSTDRKGKSKETKLPSEPVESFTNFVLPDSFPAEEVNFPPLLTRKFTANWTQILEESQQYQKEAEEYTQKQSELVLKETFKKTESDYMKEEVFTCLLPALEETLNKAKIWDVFIIQKSFFNGIDWIVQCLWNNNPRHPSRAHEPLHLFNMPWVTKLLKEQYDALYTYLVDKFFRLFHGNLLPKFYFISPRPYYPKSWLWPEDYAATLIQKTVRQYFVQREEEVQEMREFWRKIKMEQKQSQIGLNPLLARKFASSRSLTRKK